MDQGRGINDGNKIKKLFERAKKHMPGGVNSPVRAFGVVGGTPRFIASASTDKVTDADGNEYIDYVCSWGPGILGHAHPRVIAKVLEALSKRIDLWKHLQRGK